MVAAAGDAVARRQGVSEIEVIDLRDLAAELGRSMTVGFVSGEAREALDAVEAADALIVATPVFNASYSGLFKMFFDLVDIEAMTGKPVLVGATGGSPRHSMVLDHALRPLFAYLRAVVVPTGVYAASEDWAGTSGDTATLNDRIVRAATELAALLTLGRDELKPYDAGAPGGTSVSGAQRRHEAVEEAGIANFARLLGSSSSAGA